MTTPTRSSAGKSPDDYGAINRLRIQFPIAIVQSGHPEIARRKTPKAVSRTKPENISKESLKYTISLFKIKLYFCCFKH